VLGTLPSRKSLAVREYYANPQNAFWRIMGELFDAGPDLPYAERVRRLTLCGVAVWDVLASSVREGSLDAAIRTDTAMGNDFATFLRRYPDIATICFNGKKAAELFGRLAAAPALRQYAEKNRVILPSTSPAHAAMTYAEKCRQWSVVRTLSAGPT
jgi:hypoxanthine-DNA glycosylase